MALLFDLPTTGCWNRWGFPSDALEPVHCVFMGSNKKQKRNAQICKRTGILLCAVSESEPDFLICSNYQSSIPVSIISLPITPRSGRQVLTPVSSWRRLAQSLRMKKRLRILSEKEGLLPGTDGGTPGNQLPTPRLCGGAGHGSRRITGTAF